jgi:hypothetical protein
MRRRNEIWCFLAIQPMPADIPAVKAYSSGKMP